MPVHNVFPHGLPAGAPQDLLAAMGLLLAVEINVPQSLANVLTSQGAALPQPVTGSALVDTGATSCCVEESLVQGLGLQPVGASQFLASFQGQGLVRVRHEHKLLCHVGSSSSRQFQGASEGDECLGGAPAGRLRPGY